MDRQPFTTILSTFWWLLLLRGIAAILFGVLAIVWPAATVTALVIWFAVFALIDGAAALYHGIANRSELEYWWLLILEGIFGIVFGILVLARPGISTVVLSVVLVLWFAAWAIVTGAMRIAMAIRLRHEIEGEFWLGLSGLLSILFGIILMTRPEAGVVFLLYVLAAWAIITGIVMVVFAFRLKSFAGRAHRRLGTTARVQRRPR
jgi:uncharacterized membrane protein HdeD (DUF308 family)